MINWHNDNNLKVRNNSVGKTNLILVLRLFPKKKKHE